MDNLYVLNHLVQRTVEEKGDHLFVAFVDLRAAFDTVNRTKLWRYMEEYGISGGLVNRAKEMYEETRVKIRTDSGTTREFWTTKGVRQGCVLSPLLFNLYIAKLEEELCKRNIGGTKILNKRIWTLAYADDMALLANNREAMVDVLGTLRKYLKERDLILSAEETKIIVISKNGKKKDRKWEWEGKEIEEVKTFKYLGFVFNSRGTYKDHMKELSKKGRVAAKLVWGLGERLCRGNFGRRMWMFTCLVECVMAYGVELWGWEERKELERVKAD